MAKKSYVADIKKFKSKSKFEAWIKSDASSIEDLEVIRLNLRMMENDDSTDYELRDLIPEFQEALIDRIDSVKRSMKKTDIGNADAAKGLADIFGMMAKQAPQQKTEAKKIEKLIDKVQTQSSKPSPAPKVAKPKTPRPPKKKVSTPKSAVAFDRTGHAVMFPELGNIGPIEVFINEGESQQTVDQSNQMSLDFNKKIKKVAAPKKKQTAQKSTVEKTKGSSETLMLRARKLALEEAKLDEQKRRHMEGESLDREHLKTRNRERVSKEKRDKLVHDTRVRVAELEKEKIEIRVDAEKAKKELESKTKKSVQTSRARAMTQKAKVLSEAMVERERIRAESTKNKLEHTARQKKLDREHRQEMLEKRMQDRNQRARDAARAKRRDAIGSFLSEQSTVIGGAYKLATAPGFGSKFGGTSHVQKASNSNSYMHDVIAGGVMGITSQVVKGIAGILGPAIGVAASAAFGLAVGNYLYNNGGAGFIQSLIDPNEKEKARNKKWLMMSNPFTAPIAGVQELYNSMLTKPSGPSVSGKINGGPSGPSANYAGSKSSGSVSKVSITGRQKQAMDFFMSQGYSKEQAAGIVGNLMRESGAGLDTKAFNSKENAQGIAQWRKERLTKFKELFGKDVKDATFEEQLAYVAWELKNTEKAAGQKLLNATSADMAASIIDKDYERSSGAHRMDRILNARGLAAGIGTQESTNTARMDAAMKQDAKNKKAAAGTPTPVVVSNPTSISAPVQQTTTIINAPDVDPPIRQLILNNTFPSRVL